jgi:hypothetical protein
VYWTGAARSTADAHRVKRVLMVEYYFPPLGGIASVRAAGFARYLPDFGWAPTVLAPRNGSYFRDDSIGAGPSAVVRTFSAELSRLGKRIALRQTDDVKPAAVGPATGWLRERARAWLYRPDAHIGWYPFAVAAGRALLRDRRFEAIVSSSFPVTAHLVARRLAQDAGVPWIAEFRDPWADAKAPHDPQRKGADQLERRLLSAADAVVTVSPTLAALWASKGSLRTEVITNGFDPMPDISAAGAEDFVVTHVGSYYPHMQDLGALWPALRALRADGAVRPRVCWVGDMSEELRREIGGHGLGDVLEVTGFVAHEESVSRMAGSSLLVVAGTPRPHPIYDGLLPAKMFEYLGTGRPILYLGARQTDAGRLLAGQPGCWIAAADDPVALVAALGEIRRSPARYERDLEPYTRRALTGRLAALLDEVVNGARQDRVGPKARTRSA